jgi:hypothetical protein
MFKVGDIIPSNGTKGTEHYIVVESGDKPQLELIEDFIEKLYCCRPVYRRRMHNKTTR